MGKSGESSRRGMSGLIAKRPAVAWAAGPRSASAGWRASACDASEENGQRSRRRAPLLPNFEFRMHIPAVQCDLAARGGRNSDRSAKIGEPCVARRDVPVQPNRRSGGAGARRAHSGPSEARAESPPGCRSTGGDAGRRWGAMRRELFGVIRRKHLIFMVGLCRLELQTSTVSR